MVSKNSLGKKILTYLVIVIALAAFIFPIYWMVHCFVQGKQHPDAGAAPAVPYIQDH